MLSTSRTVVHLDLQVDWRLLVFLAGAGSLVTFLFGLAPAIRASAVVARRRAEIGTGRHTARIGLFRPLVAAQVAFSFIVLFVAGLCLTSFVKLLRTDLGFDRSHLALVSVAAGALPADDATAPATGSTCWSAWNRRRVSSRRACRAGVSSKARDATRACGSRVAQSTPTRPGICRSRRAFWQRCAFRSSPVGISSGAMRSRTCRRRSSSTRASRDVTFRASLRWASGSFASMEERRWSLRRSSALPETRSTPAFEMPRPRPCTTLTGRTDAAVVQVRTRLERRSVARDAAGRAPAHTSIVSLHRRHPAIHARRQRRRARPGARAALRVLLRGRDRARRRRTLWSPQLQRGCNGHGKSESVWPSVRSLCESSA